MKNENVREGKLMCTLQITVSGKCDDDSQIVMH